MTRVEAATEQSQVAAETRVRPRVRDARRWPPLVVGLVVAIPVIVAVVVMTRDRWLPVGDFAHMVFRTSQVGTRDTPLVGAYTTKGWAHPGPLLFWVAAPLYRLSGGDPRSVEWTTAAINVSCIVALMAVAWRRGGAALLMAMGIFTALLVHGLEPRELAIFWNPFVPLVPFLLTVVLVWDAGLGRWRSAALALIPASLAIQGHFAFAVLVAVLAVWLAAWTRWNDRLVPPDAAVHDVQDAAPATARARLWRATPRWLVPVVALMWVGPVVDAVADVHNPLNIAKSFVNPRASVGPLDAVSLVGRYVRPDGPWIGGAEPIGSGFSVEGSGPLPLLVALAALCWCLHVARRRQLRDVVALTTLTLLLVLCSIPATAQIVLPAFAYLTQWLKIVGGLVWFTVAWTAWRAVLEPRLRDATPRLRRTAGLIAAVGLAVAVTISWQPAVDAEQPASQASAAVAELAPQLAANIPRDQRLRIEIRGDFTASSTVGVIYWLVDHGYDVVTRDGGVGLKWGHTHRWNEGEDYDLLLTAALNRAVLECDQDPSARRLASYDALSPDERAWLTGYQFRRLGDPEAVTTAETRRAVELGADDLRLAVYAGPRICARTGNSDFGDGNSGWLGPLAAVGAVAAAGAFAGIALVRRRKASDDQTADRGPHPR